MSYFRSDVEAAVRRIEAACPGVHCERLDYGFTLLAIKGPGRRKEIIVFQPQWDERQQPERRADIDAVIKELNDG